MYLAKGACFLANPTVIGSYKERLHSDRVPLAIRKKRIFQTSIGLLFSRCAFFPVMLLAVSRISTSYK